MQCALQCGEMAALVVKGAVRAAVATGAGGAAGTTRLASSTPGSRVVAAHVSGLLEGIRDAGTWKEERVITTPQATSIGVEGQDAKVLNFCANNYLGLSDDAEIIGAAKASMDSHGNGLSSVRFICGTQDIHKELEAKIAEFHGTDDTILYASCFDANAAVFETLLSKEDAVFSDELNHASIIDGIRLSKAQRYRYTHRNMADLEAQLQKATDAGARLKLIVTDGVFSMDGNIAPLKDIRALADRYSAVVLSDECHATGFLGATGRGTPEFLGTEVEIVNSTIGKALGGSIGGYTTGPKEVIALLRQKARPYLFSNSLPPCVVGATIKVFDRLLASSELPEKVTANTKRFRDGMAAAGFSVGGDPAHPICPVHLGDARLASQFADEMLKKGIFVIGFSYPVVPEGKARIRVQISAAHSSEEIDRAVLAFKEVAEQLGVMDKVAA